MRFLQIFGYWGTPPEPPPPVGPFRGAVAIGDSLAGGVALGESMGRVTVRHSPAGGVTLKDSL